MDSVRVIAFPGAANLPLFAGLKLGLFHSHGVHVAFSTTRSSTEQFERFAAAEYDIAFTAFDNIVAYRTGQGAISLGGATDFKAILGASQIDLAVIATPDIANALQLKEKTLALDAVSTGFAFVLYSVLESLGLPRTSYSVEAVGATPARWSALKNGSHAATMTIEPFTSLAVRDGFRILGRSTEFLESYQAGVVAVRESWACMNSDTVEAFIKGYLESVEWVLAPANRGQVKDLLLAEMPEVGADAADSVLDGILAPAKGLTPGGELLWSGMKTVLTLRSRFGEPLKSGLDATEYVDLRFRDRALARS